ncbi:MAG: 2-amino-4-hydroxy-6-hydroxymethyldihydropteridine diphosphokinase [Spirochaetes bacterium]|nr:2-amino-4-hydroxy-6-hydroxymethyldihydropteridine diphosphokinase [Spirochaetota bacterium]
MIFIGIGTNLGDKRKNIEQARRLMTENQIRIVNSSSIDETEPVDFTDQPRFLNQIVAVETLLGPDELFEVLQSVEKEMKRVKLIKKGPRIIDLDLLLYNDIVHKSDKLSIPHPGIRNRDFILKHLIELDSNLTCPETGRKYLEIYYVKHK